MTCLGWEMICYCVASICINYCNSIKISDNEMGYIKTSKAIVLEVWKVGRIIPILKQDNHTLFYPQ